MDNNTNTTPKDLKSSDHFSCLLRLWRNNGQWRASLEIPKTRERVGFANLEQLFAYLMNLVESNGNIQQI